MQLFDQAHVRNAASRLGSQFYGKTLGGASKIAFQVLLKKDELDD